MSTGCSAWAHLIRNAGGAASRAPLQARVEAFSGDLSEPVGPPGASPLRILAVRADLSRQAGLLR